MFKTSISVLSLFFGTWAIMIIFIKIMVTMSSQTTKTEGNETVINCHVLKKQKETLDEIKKQNEEIIKLLKK